MIGQKKIIERINTNIPNPLLIIGSYGMGRYTVTEEIINKLEFDKVNYITEKFTVEDIDNLYITTSPQVIVIDITNLSVGKRIDTLQNSILKFLEEPPKSSQIIVLAEDKGQVIDTILNRCQIWEMEPYSCEELKEIGEGRVDNIPEAILSGIIKTPLNVLSFKPDTLNEVITLSETIVTKIAVANVSNTLSLVDRVDISDKTKLSLSMLLDGIIYHLSRFCINDFNPSMLEGIKRTHRLQHDLTVLGINKKYLFENYLLDMKDILRCN